MAMSFGGSMLRRWEGGRIKIRMYLRQYIRHFSDMKFLALARIPSSHATSRLPRPGGLLPGSLRSLLALEQPLHSTPPS